MLVGMSLYGVEAWSRNADPFGVYFGMFAALAPLTRRDGVLYARPPVVGAGTIDGRIAGTAAVLLCGIGVTAFDGASEGPLFNDALPHLQDFFRGLGFSPGTALELGFTTGLLVDRRARVADLDRRAAGRAAGALARADPRRVHRGALLLAARLQRPGAAAAGVGPARRRLRPVRRRRLGRSTTGSSRRRRSGTCRSARSCSATSRRSCSPTTARSSIHGSHRAATRSQVVMLVMMVCFTCLGLWLLSASNE